MFGRRDRCGWRQYSCLRGPHGQRHPRVRHPCRTLDRPCHRTPRWMRVDHPERRRWLSPPFAGAGRSPGAHRLVALFRRRSLAEQEVVTGACYARMSASPYASRSVQVLRFARFCTAGADDQGGVCHPRVVLQPLRPRVVCTPRRPRTRASDARGRSAQDNSLGSPRPSPS